MDNKPHGESGMNDSVLKTISLQRSEPHWLQAYRRKQFDCAQALKQQHSIPETIPEQWMESKIPDWNSLGWRVMNWELALKEIPHEIEIALNAELPPQQFDEALTNALFDSGFVAIAPEKPSTNELAFFSVEGDENARNKVLIIVPRQAIASKTFCSLNSSKEFHWNETIQLNENSSHFSARVCTMKGNASVAQQWLMGTNSKAQNANAWMQQSNLNASVSARLGKGCHFEELDAALLGGNAQLNGNLLQFHAEPHSTSYSLFKGVLRDESKSDWNGMIRIPKTGQQSNATLESHSLIDGLKASSTNIPGLEIEADDVQASHSASVTQLDEEHLFYLRSRGLNEKQAKLLMVNGFLESAWYRLPAAYYPKWVESVHAKD